ncbi:hypothetical protein WJX77_005000 [Trebouxia sp. C0004]
MAMLKPIPGEPASEVCTTRFPFTDQKAFTLLNCALAKLAPCIPLAPHHSFADTRERKYTTQWGCPRHKNGLSHSADCSGHRLQLH